MVLCCTTESLWLYTRIRTIFGRHCHTAGTTCSAWATNVVANWAGCGESAWQRGSSCWTCVLDYDRATNI